MSLEDFPHYDINTFKRVLQSKLPEGIITDSEYYIDPDSGKACVRVVIRTMTYCSFVVGNDISYEDYADRTAYQIKEYFGKLSGYKDKYFEALEDQIKLLEENE